MIHSLSGGVLSPNEKRTFVKVEVKGAAYWFLCSFAGVKEGDRVIVPFGRAELPEEGVVVKTETADAACAPVPASRAKEVCGIVR